VLGGRPSHTRKANEASSKSPGIPYARLCEIQGAGGWGLDAEVGDHPRSSVYRSQIMKAEETYVRLGRLVEEGTSLGSRPDTTELQRWAGKIYAVLMESGMGLQAAQISTAMTSFSMFGTPSVLTQVNGLLMQCLAVAEIKAPASAQGAFIATGEAFDAMAAVARVMSQATRRVRIVDPYMDDTALREFAVLVDEGLVVELLSDSFSTKPSFAPALERWHKQYGKARPLEARLSQPRALHDRLIFLDGSVVYNMSQSLAHLAQRSPASLSRLNDETAAMKIAAYEAIWDTAKPLS
jgi:hypothetical protein